MLVLSEAESTDQIRRWCDRDDARILCTAPHPETTPGEAIMLNRLAAEMALDPIAIVTCDHQLARATILDERCTCVDIVPISAQNELGRSAAIAFADCSP